MRISTIGNYIRFGAILSAAGLAGCANFHASTRNFHSTSNQINHELAQQKASVRLVSSTKAPYLLGQPIHTKARKPAVLRATIHFSSGQSLSLKQLASQVTQISGVPIDISTQVITALSSSQSSTEQVLPGLPGQSSFRIPTLPNLSQQKNKLVINQFSGPLYQLLNKMASGTGTFWIYKDGAVRFILTETKTFDINMLPGQNSSTASISDSGSQSNSGSATQKSTDSAKLDPYASVVSDIKTILAESKSASSGGGAGGQTVKVPTEVTSNPTAGSVTVTATPPELKAVAAYVRKLNHKMGQNVLIDVHIYSVTQTSGDNYGLNISATLGKLGHGFTPISISGASQTGIPTNAGSISGGIVAGSVSAQAVAKALSTAGNVSLVTSGSVIALNGQYTPLQVSQTIYYLESVSSTNTANVGSQTSLTPGHYTIGFSGTFLPLIRQGNNILLQYAINLKQDLGLTTFSSNGSSLQLPHLATQAFMQRVNIQSGQTLVLSGFQQSDYDQQHTGIGSAHFWELGGGATNNINRNRLVIVMHVARMQS